MRKYHNYTHTDPETVATAIQAGTNMELSGSPAVYSNTIKAIQKGLLTGLSIIYNRTVIKIIINYNCVIEREVRENIKALMKFRFQIGEFDPPQDVPYNLIGIEEVQKLEHRQLSLKAAQMTFVLSKNKNNFLPIQQRLGKITVRSYNFYFLFILHFLLSFKYYLP